jgi:hypothetical protein
MRKLEVIPVSADPHILDKTAELTFLLRLGNTCGLVAVRVAETFAPITFVQSSFYVHRDLSVCVDSVAVVRTSLYHILQEFRRMGCRCTDV